LGWILNQELRILGIDPGLANCGWGVVGVRGSTLLPLAYGSITTSASEEMPQRLANIYNQISEVILKYQPSDLSIETVYHKGNSKSAIATAQARGAALVAAATKQLFVGEYAPAAIKKAVVGSGSADKGQVQYMVRVILGLDHTPTPDHAADALAAAICHANMRHVRL
jgi:crossover junction endodeoxyribonuclease RuvC